MDLHNIRAWVRNSLRVGKITNDKVVHRLAVISAISTWLHYIDQDFERANYYRMKKF